MSATVAVYWWIESDREAYAGKLEQQIQITDSGHEFMSKFLFEPELMGREIESF